MNNMQRLATAENRNQKMFADTVLTLKDSQGFYSRLYRSVNNLGKEEYDHLTDLLDEQNFRDSVDVILWLEQ